MVSNWLLGDFSRLLNATNSEIENAKIKPEHLVEMLNLVDNGTISGPAAKTVFAEMFYSGKRASDVVMEKKLSQIGDATEIRNAVRRAISENAKAVTDYKAGKEQALTFITGQVMKITKGRANPTMVTEILLQELGGK